MKYDFEKFQQLKKSSKEIVKVLILSNSMHPWISKGEKIQVKKCTPLELKPYDIIIFWKNNIFICHIYIKTIDNFIITKNLHNNTYDLPTSEKHLLGRVIQPDFKWYHKLYLKFFR